MKIEREKCVYVAKLQSFFSFPFLLIMTMMMLIKKLEPTNTCKHVYNSVHKKRDNTQKRILRRRKVHKKIEKTTARSKEGGSRKKERRIR
jgi:hypothetical protein